MLSIGVLQAAFGALGVALPIGMAAGGWSPALIGVVIAAYSAGFVIGAWLSPRMIHAVGHIRAFAACAGLATAATLSQGVELDPALWIISRLIFGFMAAAIMAVAESWIADATPPEQRGAVISIYQVVGRIGLVVGPFLLGDPNAEFARSFLIIGLLLALGLVPLTATRATQPAIIGGEPASPLRLLHIAPAAAGASFFAGLINAPLVAFIPIWANGLEEGRSSAAALVMAAVFASSMILQWPFGKLSDRMDRRLVIGFLAAGAALAAFVLTIFASPSIAMGAALIGIWGAFSLTHYGIAVAHAADRARDGEMPAVASGLLMMWGVGSIIGPLLGGVIYATPLAERGLFLYAALASAVLAGLMVLRTAGRAAPAPDEREDFTNVQATSAEFVEGEGDPAAPDDIFGGDDEPGDDAGYEPDARPF